MIVKGFLIFCKNDRYITYANVEATTLWDALSRKFPQILSISRSDTSKKKRTVKARTFHRQQHPVPRGT
ncbi:hypothetical protein M413DRAFT_446056 [Hebeloma cylindrosporum]|uniref:Uncharacterized protein n=1 Tax=Hebeloma cylindrosporum TaxID=76867 RepID=A0A0C2XSF4_HEBCY|nr:hypothetical protein M413DRAFT_446056 [Hebeloma cylindrosporum h7]